MSNIKKVAATYRTMADSMDQELLEKFREDNKSEIEFRKDLVKALKKVLNSEYSEIIGMNAQLSVSNYDAKNLDFQSLIQSMVRVAHFTLVADSKTYDIAESVVVRSIQLKVEV